MLNSILRLLTPDAFNNELVARLEQEQNSNIKKSTDLRVIEFSDTNFDNFLFNTTNIRLSISVQYFYPVTLKFLNCTFKNDSNFYFSHTHGFSPIFRNLEFDNCNFQGEISWNAKDSAVNFSVKNCHGCIPQLTGMELINNVEILSSQNLIIENFILNNGFNKLICDVSRINSINLKKIYYLEYVFLNTILPVESITLGGENGSAHVLADELKLIISKTPQHVNKAISMLPPKELKIISCSKIVSAEPNYIKIIDCLENISLDLVNCNFKNIDVVNSSITLGDNSKLSGMVLVKDSTVSGQVNFDNARVDIESSKFEAKITGSVKELNVFNDAFFCEEINVSTENFEAKKAVFYKKVSLDYRGDLSDFKSVSSKYKDKLKIVGGKVKELHIDDSNSLAYMPDFTQIELPKFLTLPRKKSTFQSVKKEDKSYNQSCAHYIYTQCEKSKKYDYAGFYFERSENYKFWKDNWIAKIYNFLGSGYSWRRPLFGLFTCLVLIFSTLCYSWQFNAKLSLSQMLVNNIFNPVYLITHLPIHSSWWLAILVLATIGQVLSMFLFGLALRWRCRRG